MTALDRLVAALNNNRPAAAGTYRLVAGELDGLAERQWGQLRQLVFMRGAMDERMLSLVEPLEREQGYRVMADLDEEIADSWDSLRGTLVLRGELDGHRALSDIHRKLHQWAHPSPTHEPEPEPDPPPAVCATCGRPARVWAAGVPYCKRDAHTAGVIITGKIGDPDA